MRDTDYAFCVARLRANETKLLSNEFIRRLIEAPSYEEAVRLLTEKGWMYADDSVSEAVKNQSVSLFELLSESVPDKNVLDSLCVINDYFNIKTAVKCALTGDDAEKYYAYPTSVYIEKLSEAVRLRDFSSLPEAFSECAMKAYDIANKTENGQNADILVDKAALEALFEHSKKADNRIFSDICAFITDTSNIKIALRCCVTKKNIDFASLAVSECKYLEKDMLIKLATGDSEELYNYLLSGRYAEGVALYRESPAAFDKWCDDRIVEIIKDAQYTSFGFGPVCAYYYAKLTEIKTVRIVLASKLSGVSSDVIRERVRALYV